MRVHYKTFEGVWGTWKGVFDEAAAFASQVGPGRLIALSQSESGTIKGVSGMVTVWYWEDEPPCRDDRRTLIRARADRRPTPRPRATSPGG